MGTHYFNLDYGNKTECKKDMPLMLLYIDNNLNGFAWQHMAPLNTTGTDWEIFSIQAKLYIPNTVNTDYNTLASTIYRNSCLFAFVHENMEKLPSKVGYFTRITDIFSTALCDGPICPKTKK